MISAATRKKSLVIFSLVLCTAYLLIYGKLLGLRALVPDEANFLNWANDHVNHEIIPKYGLLKGFFYVRNLEGFGGLYWYFTAALIRAWPDPFLLIRRITLLLMCVVPFAILYVGMRKEKYSQTVIALLAWFFQPFAWWLGKVSGVESFAIAGNALAIAILLTHTSLRSLGVVFFLLGMTTALKLISISVLFFAFLYFLLNQQIHKFRLLLKNVTILSLSTLAGLSFGHPKFLISPLRELASLSKFYGPPADYFQHAQQILFGHNYQWDMVIDGGLFTLTLPFLTSIILMGFSFFSSQDKKLLIAAAGSYLFMLLLFLKNGRYFAWYWFPTIAILPFCLLMIKNELKFTGIALIAILGSGIKTVPLIYDEATSKIWHAKNFSEMNGALECAVTMLATSKPDAILAIPEVGVAGVLQKPDVWNESIFQSRLNYNFKYFNYQEGFQIIDSGNLGETFSNNQNVVLLVGNRLFRNTPDKLDNLSLEKRMNSSGKIWKLSSDKKCEFLKIVHFKKVS